jgi:hypothetical protein
MVTIISSPEYRLAEGVILLVRDRIARLLDFDRGRFYGLDLIGTELLEASLAEGIGAAVERVACRYGADPTRVQADLNAMLVHLQRLGLLDQASKANRRRTPGFRRTAGLVAQSVFVRPLGWLATRMAAGRPGRATVRLALLTAWASLRLIGWYRTIVWLHRLSGGVKPVQTDPTHTVELDRLLRAVAAQTILFPMVCKERAVAAAFLLWAVRGQSGSIVVGLDCYPFRAHAWVEAEGRILTDDPERCRNFEPVARYAWPLT